MPNRKPRRLTWGLVAAVLIIMGAWVLWPSVGAEVGASLGEQPSQDAREGPRSDMDLPAPSEVGGRVAAAGAEQAPAKDPSEQHSLEDWLRAITESEAGIARNAGADSALHHELEGALEEAIGAVMAEDENLSVILGMLAGRPDGSLGLTEDVKYGASRALYWWVVVEAGRDAERETVVAILSALPEIHADVVDFLIDNLVEARVDGRLILDGSYLQVILQLRSAYPEAAERYSRLFEVVGETMTAEERTQFFSLFLEDKQDPALVGLVIKGLLEGSDPTLGLLLAAQVADDLELPMKVRVAAARAVSTNADVYSATDFLTERADWLRNDFSTWFGLGIRGEAHVAAAQRYQELASSGANPKARMMLVVAMRGASSDELLSIARAETDSGVIGQALTSASNKDDCDASEVLDFLDARRGLDPLAGGVAAVSVIGTSANLAHRAKTNGQLDVLERAIANLKAAAVDPSVHPTNRKQAIKDLKNYLPAPEIQELYDSIE